MAAALADRQDVATLLTDKMTTLAAVDVPGLVRHRVYEATHLSPYKPIVHYVGYAIGLPAVVLSEDPKAFLAMVKAGGAKIESAEQAAGYGAGFLTCTRPLSRLAYIVQSAGEVSFRPNLSGGAAKTKDRFQKKYADVIAPPSAEARGKDFTVTVYMVVEQELRRVRMKIGADGSIDPDADVLEKGLPLVEGGR